MSKKLEEKYFKISEPIAKKFNSHTYEERVELAMYSNDVQCLTLIQILGKYDHLLPKVAKDKINAWLESSLDELEKSIKVNNIKVD